MIGFGQQSRAIERAEALIDLCRRQQLAEQCADRSSLKFDDNGDLIEIVEYNGERLVFAYDADRRVIRAGATRYRYGTNDRLCQINAAGVATFFEHDDKGRLTSERRGNAGSVVYRYDDSDRVVLGRTASIAISHEYDNRGNICRLTQSWNGADVDIALTYDGGRRLTRMVYPGGLQVGYHWNARDRLTRVEINSQAVVDLEYDQAAGACVLRFANGVTQRIVSDLLDHRPLESVVRRDGNVLWRREFDYGVNGLIAADGWRRYAYDALGQLVRAEEPATSDTWTYSWPEPPSSPGIWTWRCDDADHLIEVRRRGDIVATFEYDFRGRLALSRTETGVERFIYGPSDELVAVVDETGRPKRLYVPTPFGNLAEIRGSSVFFLHNDQRGTCHLVTDQIGDVTARFRYDPFGLPLDPPAEFLPVFGGRIWVPPVELYCHGARWYSPGRRRFLTADSYTARPDDARLVNATAPARLQVQLRQLCLADWLRSPRARDRHAYCANDPVNRVDPTGHWSFGGVLLLLFGLIWSLPNTLLALIIEITCILIEPIRVLVAAIRGHPRWTVGFDAAASSRLSTFAIVFRGGWFGSFDGMLAFTFGNCFFVNQDWETKPLIAQGGDVEPLAYNGTVSLTRKEALYEHMLRHANQCSWLGPLFHLGLPLFGFYWWDRWTGGSAGGGANSILERDARNYGGI